MDDSPYLVSASDVIFRRRRRSSTRKIAIKKLNDRYVEMREMAQRLPLQLMALA